jgi:protein involved in polysaccharide export with SLBB domain
LFRVSRNKGGGGVERALAGHFAIAFFERGPDMRFTASLVMMVVGLAGVLGGCQSGPTARERDQLKHFQRAHVRTVSTDRFMLSPPDVITIYAPKAPEVDKQKMQIAPDGTINLDLLNRVYVAGMSPQEVESLLAEKLRTFYQDVKVRVDVEYRSQWYYVFGETNKSGPKPYTGRDTLVMAVSEAQLTRLSWPERIYVIKPSPDPNERHVTVVNLKDIIQRGDSSPNILLEQDDIVYVPLNPLAAIGVAVQNLLFPVQPIVQAAGSARAVGF